MLLTYSTFPTTFVRDCSMASRLSPTSISGDQFREIFGNVDEEFDENDSDNNFTDFGARRDEESHSENEKTSSKTSKDSINAETPWRIELSNFEVSEFSEPGLRFHLQDDAKTERYFLNVFGEQTVDLIVEKTNQYVHQSLRNNPAGLATWKNVSKEELKAFFGVFVIMGINQLPRIADYWKDDPFTGNTGIKQTMTRNRFQEIFQLLHSADSTRSPARGENSYDRLYKVRAVLNTVLENSQRCYSPNNHIAIDEGMIAFKGRLSFRQYMPAELTKYGIKVWMAADSKNGYIINYNVYLGSEESIQRIHDLATR